MVQLGPGKDPIVQPAYPHMLGEDTAVWTRFLESGDFNVREVWYDVHVGQGVIPDMVSDSMLKRISQGITRKRIDVVAVVDNILWVIEVKPVLMHFALGQVLVYTGLFIDEYNPELEVWPVIVCDTVDEDVVKESRRLGVAVVANF